MTSNTAKAVGSLAPPTLGSSVGADDSLVPLPSASKFTVPWLETVPVAGLEAAERSFEEACAQVDQFPPQRISAKQTEHQGETWLMIPDGHGYPVLGQSLASAKRG